MKKQTGYIIFMFLSIILLCLYFGKSIIHEGNQGQPSTLSDIGNTTNYRNASSNLDFVNGIFQDKGQALTAAEIAAKLKELEAKSAEALSEQAKIDLQKTIKEYGIILQNIIDSSFTPSVVYLPLKKDAANVANKKFPDDPSNMMNHANVDISGKTTNVQYKKKDGKDCVYFNNSMENYLSFPFYITTNFSFCFWVYLDVNDIQNYYTVVSATSKELLNPSIQVDIRGGRILVYNALPTNNSWTIVHDYTVQTSGWAHIAYTFERPHTAKVYINKNLSGFVQNVENSKLNFFNNDLELIKNTADTFIIGRSGDTDRAFNGYVHDFSYYAMTLTPEQISQMYDYTK